MSSANIKAIQALEAMRSALLKFKADAADSLNAMLSESRRTKEWLQERQRHWQKEIRRRIESLQQAQADLTYCQCNDCDCSWEVRMVKRAQQDLDDAEQQLRAVQLHLKQVCNAHDEFEREARRLNNMLERELLQGTTLLTRSFETLSNYAGGGSSSVGSTGQLQSAIPVITVPVITGIASIIREGRLNVMNLMEIVPTGPRIALFPANGYPMVLNTDLLLIM